MGKEVDKERYDKIKQNWDDKKVPYEEKIIRRIKSKNKSFSYVATIERKSA